jgi:hypothetical protein
LPFFSCQLLEEGIKYVGHEEIWIHICCKANWSNVHLQHTTPHGYIHAL